MEKKTLYALIALVLLGGAAVLVMRAPEKGDRVGAAPRPIATLDEASLASVELTTTKGDKIALAKKGDGWRLTAPKDNPADKLATKPLVDGLTHLKFGDPVTEEPTKYAELGVADGKAPHVVAKDASGKVLADFLLGKSIGGYIMLRPLVAGKSGEVWQSSGLAPTTVDKEPAQWRDHTVLTFASGDAEQLAVTAGKELLIVDKPSADDKAKDKPAWRITRADGAAPKTSTELDLAEVDATIGQLANLRAADFVDDKKPSELGLDPPALTVAVSAKGKKYTLLIGNDHGDEGYVKALDNPQIFSIKRAALDRVGHRPIDYRDKLLLAGKEGDLASVEITVGSDKTVLTHSGNDWKVAGGTVDDGKVKGLIAGLDRVAADRFADASETPGALTGSVVARKKDGSQTALKFFGPSKDAGSVYVQKVGKPETLVIKKWVVDRLLKKPNELLKSATPAKTPVAKNEKKKK